MNSAVEVYEIRAEAKEKSELSGSSLVSGNLNIQLGQAGTLAMLQTLRSNFP